MEGTERDSSKKYETLTDWARDLGRVVVVPVARFLAGLGVRPNTVTLVGFILTLGVTVLIATGRLTLSGWLLLLILPLDAVDGALARMLDRESCFGAFLDSTLDRLSDASLLGGLAIYYLRRDSTAEVVAVLVALVGSLLVSYLRARAEGLGFTCKVGLLTRLERGATLVVGLILALPRVTVWVLAVGSAVTALQRFFHVYRASRSS